MVPEPRMRTVPEPRMRKEEPSARTNNQGMVPEPRMVPELRTVLEPRTVLSAQAYPYRDSA